MARDDKDGNEGDGPRPMSFWTGQDADDDHELSVHDDPYAYEDRDAYGEDEDAGRGSLFRRLRYAFHPSASGGVRRIALTVWVVIVAAVIAVMAYSVVGGGAPDTNVVTNSVAPRSAGFGENASGSLKESWNPEESSHAPPAGWTTEYPMGYRDILRATANGGRRLKASWDPSPACPLLARCESPFPAGLDVAVVAVDGTPRTVLDLALRRLGLPVGAATVEIDGRRVVLDLGQWAVDASGRVRDVGAPAKDIAWLAARLALAWFVGRAVARISFLGEYVGGGLQFFEGGAHSLAGWVATVVVLATLSQHPAPAWENAAIVAVVATFAAGNGATVLALTSTLAVASVVTALDLPLVAPAASTSGSYGPLGVYAVSTYALASAGTVLTGLVAAGILRRV